MNISEIEILDRLPAVLEQVPLGRSSILQKVREGTFPAPYSIGARAVAWKRSEVQAWLLGCKRKSEKPAGMGLMCALHLPPKEAK